MTDKERALYDKHVRQVDFIIEHGVDYLTNWEQAFIDSIQSQLTKEKDTSFKQQKVLNRIHEKVTEKVG